MKRLQSSERPANASAREEAATPSCIDIKRPMRARKSNAQIGPASDAWDRRPDRHPSASLDEFSSSVLLGAYGYMCPREDEDP